MPYKPRVILIDTKNLALISRFSEFKDPASLPDDPSVWRKLLAGRLASLVAYLGAENFVLFLDSEPYLRTQTYPMYKRNRVEDTENGHNQWLAMREAIIQLKTKYPESVCSLPGYEADDLIARYITRYARYAGHTFIIASSDKDLRQMQQISPDIHFWSLYKWNWIPAPTEYDWRQFLALVGDSGDNISGCTGPKTAEKLLTGQADWEAFMAKPYSPKKVDQEAIELGFTQNLVTMADVYARNLKLVSLYGKHSLVPNCPIPKLPTEPFGILPLLRDFLNDPQWDPDYYSPEATEDNQPIIVETAEPLPSIDDEDPPAEDKADIYESYSLRLLKHIPKEMPKGWKHASDKN